MYHVDVKDTKDTCVPVWVVVIPGIFMGDCHNITVCPGVDWILLTPHVVCRVVNAHCLVVIHLIVDYLHCVLFILRVDMFRTVRSMSKQVRQHEILEVWIEILVFKFEHKKLKKNLAIAYYCSQISLVVQPTKNVFVKILGVWDMMVDLWTS